MENNKFCYDYPRPAVSADCVLFGFDGEDLNVLLIERGREPFKGRWTFPGGFMEMDETTLQCAERELKEETGLDGLYLEQTGAYSGVDRDPRGRVITVAYFALVQMSKNDPVAGDDAVNAKWFKIKDIPALAFDHDLVLRTAVGRLRSDLIPDNTPFRLKKEFPGNELEKLKQIVSELDYEPCQPE